VISVGDMVIEAERVLTRLAATRELTAPALDAAWPNYCRRAIHAITAATGARDPPLVRGRPARHRGGSPSAWHAAEQRRPGGAPDPWGGRDLLWAPDARDRPCDLAITQGKGHCLNRSEVSMPSLVEAPAGTSWFN
jgi:hypothetical protein